MHEGEYVLNREQARGGGGGVSVAVTVNAAGDAESVASAAANATYSRVLHAVRHSKSMRDSIGAGQRGSLHT